jgi:hypothetical protein
MNVNNRKGGFIPKNYFSFLVYVFFLLRTSSLNFDEFSKKKNSQGKKFTLILINS